MSIPSFESKQQHGKNHIPRLYVLEVRDKSKLLEPPIAHLFVEHTEKVLLHPNSQEVWKAAFVVSYEVVSTGAKGGGMEGAGQFCASYEGGALGGKSTVWLTSAQLSGGTVALEPAALRGQGVGSFFMNHIMLWAQQWPDAQVDTVHLHKGPQAGDDNHRRRNRFYEQFGLLFDYVDADKHAGTSRPLFASALRPREDAKPNLRVVDVRDFVTEHLQDARAARSETLRLRTTVQTLERLRALTESAPLLWALEKTWVQHQAMVLWVGLLGVLLIAAWAGWGG